MGKRAACNSQTKVSVSSASGVGLKSLSHVTITCKMDISDLHAALHTAQGGSGALHPCHLDLSSTTSFGSGKNDARTISFAETRKNSAETEKIPNEQNLFYRGYLWSLRTRGGLSGLLRTVVDVCEWRCDVQRTPRRPTSPQTRKPPK